MNRVQVVRPVKASLRPNLKAARIKARMTLNEVAEAIHVSPRNYQRIESGQTEGKAHTWDAIEDLFGLPQRALRKIGVQADLEAVLYKGAEF